MAILNDHVLLTAVVSSAVCLYAVEMLFFWSRWRRLALQMNQEGGAHTLVQELQAEVDILAAEVSDLRRQLLREGDMGGLLDTVIPTAKISSIPAGGRSRSSVSGGVPRTSVSTGETRQGVQDEKNARRSHSASHTSALSNGFSRGVEMLHRRVVELARSGLDSTAIATECQLSQTETELILSLNGIKRT